MRVKPWQAALLLAVALIAVVLAMASLSQNAATPTAPSAGGDMPITKTPE
jgi:hypothetical protein